MNSINRQLIGFRNVVDNVLYGCKYVAEVNKRKFMLDKASIGSAVAYATRNKIYNDFLDIIYIMRKKGFPKERIILLEKRIRIHSNQIKKLDPSNYIDNKNGLTTLLNWVKITQIKLLAVTDPKFAYEKLIK